MIVIATQYLNDKGHTHTTHSNTDPRRHKFDVNTGEHRGRYEQSMVSVEPGFFIIKSAAQGGTIASQ